MTKDERPVISIPIKVVEKQQHFELSSARALSSARSSQSRDDYKFNWDYQLSGDDFIQSAILQKRDVASGGFGTVAGAKDVVVALKLPGLQLWIRLC